MLFGATGDLARRTLLPGLFQTSPRPGCCQPATASSAPRRPRVR
ncbi:hypothetical protein ACFW3D_41165 [Streptomyces sp. NPDC058864]